MFLLVLAYPGCPGSKAVKRSLFLPSLSKLVNILQSYKQECDCFVQFVRLTTTLLKDEESAETTTFLLVTLPNIH